MTSNPPNMRDPKTGLLPADPVIVRNAAGERFQYFKHTQNWLAALAGLERNEILTVHPMGRLTARAALEAVVATYGVREFEITQHGTALHISKHFSKACVVASEPGGDR